MVNKNLLEKMYTLKYGVKSLNRVYYPKKARSCLNCHFNDYDIHNMRSRGCLYFESKDEKPIGICIPVRYDSHISEAHADNVGIWIMKNLMNKK